MNGYVLFLLNIHTTTTCWTLKELVVAKKPEVVEKLAEETVEYCRMFFFLKSNMSNKI